MPDSGSIRKPRAAIPFPLDLQRLATALPLKRANRCAISAHGQRLGEDRLDVRRARYRTKMLVKHRQSMVP